MIFALLCEQTLKMYKLHRLLLQIANKNPIENGEHYWNTGDNLFF